MSKDLHNNFDDFFKKSLNNYGEEPPSEIWNNIEKNIPLKNNKKTNFKQIFSYAAIVIALFSIIYFFHSFNNKLNLISQKVEQNNQEIKSLKNQNDSLKLKIENQKQKIDTVFFTETIYKTVYYDNFNSQNIDNYEDELASDDLEYYNFSKDNFSQNENNSETDEYESNENIIDKTKESENNIIQETIIEKTEFCEFEMDSINNLKIPTIEKYYLSDINLTPNNDNKIENIKYCNHEPQLNDKEMNKLIAGNNKKLKKNKHEIAKDRNIELFAWLKKIDLKSDKKQDEIITAQKDIEKNNENETSVQLSEKVFENEKIDESKNSSKDIVIIDNKDIKSSEKHFFNNFSIGIQTTGIINSKGMRINPPKNPNIQPKNKEFVQLSHQNTLIFGFSNSRRLEILSGIGYSIINHKIKNDLIINYDSQNEHILPNGEIATRYSTDFSNPFGVSVAYFDIIKQQEHIITENELNAEFFIYQQVKRINIPIIFKYYLINYKIGFNINSGLEANFVISQTSKIEDFKINESELRLKENSLTVNKLPNKCLVEVFLGFGLNYRFLNGFNFYFEPKISSIVNNKIKQKYIEKPYFFNFNIGIQMFL